MPVDPGLKFEKPQLFPDGKLRGSDGREIPPGTCLGKGDLNDFVHQLAVVRGVVICWADGGYIYDPQMKQRVNEWYLSNGEGWIRIGFVG